MKGKSEGSVIYFMVTMEERIEGEDNLGLVEVDVGTVKRRSVAGVVALAGRTFVMQVVAFGATFLLTIFLLPGDYGVFFMVSAVVAFLTYFSDIGLAAALVQKKDKLTREELTTTFTVQQMLVVGIIIMALGLSPLVRRYYNLSPAGLYLMWALVLSLVFSSLKTIPSVLLERKLEFGKLVIPQLLETVVFYGAAVILAWRGAGVMSFTVAVVLRGIVGTAAMYVIRPWRVGVGFNRQAFRSLLRFGLPYQANTMLAMVKDDGMTVVLGGLLGATAMGYLGWAKKWAEAPLRFFMDQVVKVTFPAFSRLQHDEGELARAVEKAIFFVAFLVFPALVGLGMVARPLTEVIPKYEKWQPALVLLYLYGGAAAWAAVTTPLTNLLSAVGKIKITLYLMIMWTGLTWMLVLPAGIKYGMRGVAGAALLVGCSSLVAIWVARKQVKFELGRAVMAPIAGSMVMGVGLWVLRGVAPVSFLGVGMMVVVGLAIYVGVVFSMKGEELVEDAKKIIKNFRLG